MIRSPVIEALSYGVASQPSTVRKSTTSTPITVQISYPTAIPEKFLESVTARPCDGN
ncbi:MAG: hypothetical protein AAGD11_13510 [Planctomycetota bacterium]